ncbi:MAG: leucine-rich repeat domain-containing protein, partial [Oscillospiraceae bacterium]|nr:leucine-rich repeat domain-containing protein [Oscillospiraceae bacterium]
MKKRLPLALVVILILVTLLGAYSVAGMGDSSVYNETYGFVTDAIDCREAGHLFADVVMDDGSLGWCPVIYEREQAEQEMRAQAAGAFRAASMSDVHGELRVLHQATDTTNRIIIKMIADRYTEAQQETFFYDAQNMANHIVSSHPMYYFAPWIQIYGIGTISPHQDQSVIVGDGSAGTAIGQITATNTRPFVQHHFPGANQSETNNHSWLVIQRGRGGGYAWMSAWEGWDWEYGGVAVTGISVGVGLHELAHLWGLWDEYDSEWQHFPTYRNRSNTRSDVNLANPTGGVLSPTVGINTAITPQWGLFIGDTPGEHNQWQGVANMGVYRMITVGWGDTTWYRPRQRCIMNQASSVNETFCLVCAEHLARRFAPDRTDDIRIRSYAHAGNPSLETIHIPASVATIGDFAFIGATGLRTIYNDRIVPQQVNDMTFARLDRANITVHIPFGTRQAYIAAGWDGFDFVEDANPPDLSVTFHFYGRPDAPVVMPMQMGQPLCSVAVADITKQVVGEGVNGGLAFWGWFTAEQLNSSGRTRDGHRRPTVGAVGFDLAAALTAEQFSLLDANGNIDLFAVWARWGDVDDDDTVTPLDLNLVRQYLRFVPEIQMVRQAAYVTRGENISPLDLNMIR